MKCILVIGFVFLPFCLFAQDSAAKKATWSLSGYLKDMAGIRFGKDFSQAAATNLLHNRMNLKWKPAVSWSGRLEVRTRLYWGEDVWGVPDFKQQLRNKNEAVNLSANWFATRSAVLYTNIERLWLEYKKSRWNMRAGRQRINWGMCNTWNPNDLFNTYNFLDFDYEERPGSDAVKGQYQISDRSHVEVAAAVTGHQPIIAAKYLTNYRKFDLQGIIGAYQNSFTAGVGWAGSIGEVGFKGEAQFYANERNPYSNLLLSLEGDYVFKNGWYLSSAFLYNQKGVNSPLNDWTKPVFQVTPRSLMPTKWNLLVNSSKEFTPLFSGSLNVVYAPCVNLLILYPTLRYNLKTAWDLDFVWQSFFAQTTTFEALSHAGYLRLRWSF